MLLLWVSDNLRTSTYSSQLNQTCLFAFPSRTRTAATQNTSGSPKWSTFEPIHSTYSWSYRAQPHRAIPLHSRRRKPFEWGELVRFSHRCRTRLITGPVGISLPACNDHQLQNWYFLAWRNTFRAGVKRSVQCSYLIVNKVISFFLDYELQVVSSIFLPPTHTDTSTWETIHW